VLKNFFPKKIFYGFSKFGCTLQTVTVLADLRLDVGTSVVSALTAETIFEIAKCISDVMPARVRVGSKSEIFRFFKSGYAHDRNISIC